MPGLCLPFTLLNQGPNNANANLVGDPDFHAFPFFTQADEFWGIKEIYSDPLDTSINPNNAVFPFAHVNSLMADALLNNRYFTLTGNAGTTTFDITTAWVAPPETLPPTQATLAGNASPFIYSVTIPDAGSGDVDVNWSYGNWTDTVNSNYSGNFNALKYNGQFYMGLECTGAEHLGAHYFTSAPNDLITNPTDAQKRHPDLPRLRNSAIRQRRRLLLYAHRRSVAVNRFAKISEF
jgi:hypothetical protein